MTLALAKLPSAPTSYADVAHAVESVDGWLVPGQEKFLFDLVRTLPQDALILELGAFKGRATAAMAFACVGTDRRVISVDSWCGNDGLMGRAESDTLNAWSANLRRCGVDGYAASVRGWTHEVLARWTEKVDFVFIDASHEHLDVLRDFDLVYPHVKDGGWIGFHDVEPSWPGPWRVWLANAAPVLSDHRFSTTLACGRKRTGATIPRPGLFHPSAHWIADLERSGPHLAALTEAMNVSRLGSSDGPEQSAALRNADAIVAEMPAPFAKILHNMLGKDAAADGVLCLWQALVLMREGKLVEAAARLDAATTVSYALPSARVAGYRDMVYRALDAHAPAPAHSATREERALAAFIRSRDFVVGLASGDGDLLARLPGATKVGIEPDIERRKRAALRFGIDSFASAEALPMHAANVVLGGDALARSLDPVGLLRSARDCLARDGRLVLWLPSAAAPSDDALFTWTSTSARALARACGYDVTLAVDDGDHVLLVGAPTDER